MEQNLGAMICHDMPYWPCEKLPGTTTSWNLDISQGRPRMNAASSRAVYSNNRLKKHTADYYGNDIQVGG